MVCNAIMAAGMGKLAEMIEGGMSHRDAVAQMYKEPSRNFEHHFGESKENHGKPILDHFSLNLLDHHRSPRH